jgi:quinol monooxygenase YgiN
MSQRGLVVVAVVRAKEGKEEQLRQSLLAMVTPTRSEPGCIRFQVHQALKDKSLFMSYEVWADVEALQNHMQTPYMKAFMGRAPELAADLDRQALHLLGIESNPDISEWTRIGRE